MRFFDDGSEGPYRLWFELAPDRFWLGLDENDARDTSMATTGVSLDQLQTVYPHGVVFD